MKKLITDIDEFDYIDADFLAEARSSQLVASTMFDKIFIPSKRIPKEMLSKIADDKNLLEQQLLANLPLFETIIEQPYWAKGENKRFFDQINCEVYGAICLADDRHLLDTIIAHGAMINNASKYTLRQIAELSRIEVNWHCYPNQSEIDTPLKNHGTYFHIPFKNICKAMSLTNSKPNRDAILQRLRRLSLMQLFLTFHKDEQAIPSRSAKISLVDRDFYSLQVPKGIRNQKSITNDTVTDLVVNISSFYVKSLDSDGQISRKRFLNNYVFLNGKNGIVDFLKFIDSHKRSYIHGKYLSVLVTDYYSGKMSMFGMNKNHKILTTMRLIAEMQDELKVHFNIILKKEVNAKSLSKKEDWMVLHTPLLNSASSIN